LLAKGGLTLSQAEALTLGSDEAQRNILEQIENGSEASAEDIKATLLDDRPTVALAIFPVEHYTGTITTDLFAEDETSYFDDAEQFMALQKEAVAELVKHHEDSAAWVDLTQGWHSPEWQYRKARKNQKGGVLINLAPSGRVEIREGLVRPKIEKETAKATAENPVAPAKVKAAYPKSLCAYIAHHKAASLAEILLSSPRAAQEVMIVRTLKEFRPHESIKALAKEADPQSAYRVLETQARQFAGRLGFVIEEGESVWDSFPPAFTDELALYEAVRGFSDHDLAELQTLLTALSFGQETCDRLDTGDSLFNRVARDLSVES
jgi:ParB family transcriptional regulator, chromosome partitioning protein